MNNPEASSDILVIHQNRIVFSSGYGALTKHSKTAASVTQVLTLFSEKIVKGEPIHFIRFEHHRMIFLTSRSGGADELISIVLIPIEKSARQVIPAMGIILKLLEEFLEGNVLDAGIAFVKKVIAGDVDVKPINRDPIDIPGSLPDVDIGHLSRKTDEILKKAILEGAKLTLEEGLELEARLFGECVRTKDMRIGMDNFMKFGPKQKARFAHV